MAGSPLIVTVCIRHSVNSNREDVVNVPACPAPNVPVNVVDIDPPPGHGLVIVCDSPSGEKVIAAFIVAWFTAPIQPGSLRSPVPGSRFPVPGSGF
jgi:hypothetical protein